MANNFDDTLGANLVGLWDFRTQDGGNGGNDTGLDDGVAQNGVFVGDAVARDDQLQLDGNNGDRFDVRPPDTAFDLSEGTIITEFTQADNSGPAFQTVVNRGEFWDSATEGYFEIHATQDGAVVVTHIAGGQTVVESTGPGFFAVGETVKVTYSWSDTGGGQFNVDNLDQGSTITTDITVTGLTMDIGDNDQQAFTFGARENTEDEFIKFFNGEIDYVAVYDSAGNGNGGPDGIVLGTAGDDIIDLAYTGDPDGDRVDNNDSIFPPVGSNDDIIEAGGGNDIINSGLGSDTVRGGAGNDTINTDGNPTAIPPLLDLGFPSYNGLPAIPADTDPTNDIDTVFGGAGDDIISTGDDADFISGGAGNDRLDGGIDADVIEGGIGNDFIIGGEGSDRISGGAGSDTIYGGLGPTLPDVLNIRDDLPGALADPRPDNGQDFIDGGGGNDFLYGQDDDDTIRGGDGNDLIDGGIDEDDLYGDADRDTFVNLNQGDFVDGGDTFSNPGRPQDDFDTLDLRGSAENSNPGGALRVELSATDPEDGTVRYFDADGNETGTLEFFDIERIIPCFTPGTMIATPKGERRVEELQVGDRVITRDNGIQEIRWLGKRTLNGTEVLRAPHLNPVLIRQGALGNGLPERDMMVSPNHRVLVSNDKTSLYFEESEVLVSAKHLTGLDGVDLVEVSTVTYIHFMFDQHEVVLSDGAWTESFQPGDQTLAGIGNAQRQEIFELFPELKTAEGVDAYQAARRSLKKHEAFLVVN